MAPSGFRFRPPAFPLDDPDLQWVLIRAFAPAGTAAPAGVSPDAVLARARELSLAARVAAQAGRERLTAELGADAAGEFLAASRVAAARALQLESLRGRVSAVARSLEVPLVLLKFAALESAGRLAPGSRSASDLDVLVSASDAGRLIAGLSGSGFEAGHEPDQEHHWPALFSQGVALELHRHLPGVTAPGQAGAFVTLPVLAECEALVEVEPGLHRPADAVLGAHLLAHALAQHGLTPEAYPVLRAFGDLSDLGLASAPDETWEEIRRWLAMALSSAEIDAARELLRRLAAGDLEDLEGNARVLLSHILAGVFDPHYRSALKLRLFASPLSERTRGRAFAAFLGRTVWLSDAQIDAIYGRPRSRLGYLGRRLWRPFDLLGRSVRAAWAMVGRRG
jgi:hypothetical protein